MADFEVIIVDDGSTDGSLEIARDYQSDSRVKVFINETNLGDFPNRNRAAAHAAGKYLKYVDSDDAIYPHCLEVMTHMMERYPRSGHAAVQLGQPGPTLSVPVGADRIVPPVFHRRAAHEQRSGNHDVPQGRIRESRGLQHSLVSCPQTGS